MECKRCTKKIDELEMYCEECKKVLRKETELNELILENQKLNELEKTIEVENISDIKDDVKEIETTKEDTKEIKTEENIKRSKEEDEIIDEFEKINKPNKKKIIIIVSIVLVLLISLIISLVLIFNKKEDEEIITIDYKKVINEYGDSVKNTLKKYLEDSEEIPSWSTIIDLNKYDKYNVECKTHKLYKDGNIYLNNCKVDNKKVKYSYGEKQKEAGRELNFYKITGNGVYYSSKQEGTSELVGSITCETDKCKEIFIFEQYAIIFEKEKYYLYDYVNNTMEFGPFDINNKEESILTLENKLYGIIYYENNIKNIYSIESSKTLKNIKGDLLTDTLDLNPAMIYKYGYAIFLNNNIYEFINLNSGNISYSIDGELNSFIEDKNNNIVYITTRNKNNKKITIYNSNGKKLFDGKEFNYMNLSNNNLIVADDNSFYIYDSKLKLKLNSKEYEKVLKIYDDFAIVIDNGYLEIVDMNDNILATFDLEWDSTKYTLNYDLSGKDNNKIYLSVYDVINNKTYKYSYLLSTKEIVVE